MKVLIRIFGILCAQGLGLVVATLLHHLLYGRSSLYAILAPDYWSIMMLVSSVGLAIVGAPALFFIALSGLQGRALFMTFVGGFGAVLFVVGFTLLSSPAELPSLWMASFAAIHGCVTGLAFALFMKAIGDAGTIDESLVEAGESIL